MCDESKSNIESNLNLSRRVQNQINLHGYFYVYIKKKEYLFLNFLYIQFQRTSLHI